MWPNNHWVKGYDCFPQPTGYGPCNKAQDAVRLLCCQGQEALPGWGCCLVGCQDQGSLAQLLARLQKSLHQEGNLLTFLKILLFSAYWKMPISSPAFWHFTECMQLFFLVKALFWQNINLLLFGCWHAATALSWYCTVYHARRSTGGWHWYWCSLVGSSGLYAHYWEMWQAASQSSSTVWQVQRLNMIYPPLLATEGRQRWAITQVAQCFLLEATLEYLVKCGFGCFGCGQGRVLYSPPASWYSFAALQSH